MALITKIGVHHSGPIGSNPLSKSGHLTVEQINAAHKERWPDLPSELNGSYIGYTFTIAPDGTWKQHRLIGEETAAAKGSNFDTVHICLIGNFTKGSGESPTEAQKKTLKWIIEKLESGFFSDKFKIKRDTSWGFSRDRVYPHRVLQPNHTSCYGNQLSDTWARELMGAPVFTNDIEELGKIIIALKKIVVQLLQRKLLGVRIQDCGECDVRG